MRFANQLVWWVAKLQTRQTQIFHAQIMATVLPPKSKRQKLAESEKVRENIEIPAGLGSVRVQFRAADSGQNVFSQISVPVADATSRNLETLLNTLLDVSFI